MSIEIDISEELCCICLDECNNKKIFKTKKYTRFKCCNRCIHKNCLLILILNDFKICPLCRSNIDIKDYFKDENILHYLNSDDIILYINNTYNVIYELRKNYMDYLFKLFIINVILIFKRPIPYIKNIFTNLSCFSILNMLKLMLIIIIMTSVIYTIQMTEVI